MDLRCPQALSGRAIQCQIAPGGEEQPSHRLSLEALLLSTGGVGRRFPRGLLRAEGSTQRSCVAAATSRQGKFVCLVLVLLLCSRCYCLPCYCVHFLVCRCTHRNVQSQQPRLFVSVSFLAPGIRTPWDQSRTGAITLQSTQSMDCLYPDHRALSLPCVAPWRGPTGLQSRRSLSHGTLWAYRGACQQGASP